MTLSFSLKLGKFLTGDRHNEEVVNIGLLLQCGLPWLPF
jgi:hypothetical protein